MVVTRLIALLSGRLWNLGSSEEFRRYQLGTESMVLQQHSEMFNIGATRLTSDQPATANLPSRDIPTQWNGCNMKPTIEAAAIGAD